MKKYILYNLAALALIMGTFVACNTAEQDVEPVVSPDGYPNVTFTPAESYSTIKEGDTVYYNVSTDKMLDRALTFSARIVDGNADDHDLIVTSGVIAAFTTEATVRVIFPQDWDAEATETVSLEYGIFAISDRYLVNPTTENPVLDLSVENYVSDDLTVTIGWAQEVDGTEFVEGDTPLPNGDIVHWTDTVPVTVDAGDEMDFDIYITPIDSFDKDDIYRGVIPNYTAATPANPEVMTISGLEDGEYVIWTDLWSNGMIELISIDDTLAVVPVTAIFERQGTVLNVSVDQDTTEAPPVNTPGADDEDPPIGFNGVIAKVKLENGVYTIIDWEDDTELGAARKSARTKTPRPVGIRK